MSENAGHLPHTAIEDLGQDRCGSIQKCMDRTCKQLGICKQKGHTVKRGIGVSDHHRIF